MKNKNLNSITLLSALILLLPSLCKSHEVKEDIVETIIQKFIINNPDLIQSSLDNHKINLEKQKIKKAINALKIIENPAIFHKDANITIYEFFDYNCGYCKSVLKVVLETLAEDKKINFVFVEYPILSKESYIASVAALASKKQGLYNDFHSSLMSLKGRISEKEIYNVAKKTGLNVEQLKVDMNNPKINKQLIRNSEIAKQLNLNGTPAFIIGDIIYPGALDKNNLNIMIKNFRES